MTTVSCSLSAGVLAAAAQPLAQMASAVSDVSATLVPTRLHSVAPSPAFWAAISFYVVATALLLAVLGGQKRMRQLALGIVVAAFVMHGVDIGWRGTQGVHPAQSVREALGFLGFIVAGGYLLASLRYRLTLGGAVVMPIALVLLLAARLSPTGTNPAGLSVLGRVHISLATIGIAVFALASVLSAMYLTQDRAMKRKRFDTMSSADAPLDGLDRLAHRLIWFGFPVFTLALALGTWWTAELRRSFLRLENLAAVITWAAFAGVLVMRAVYGWRGRRSAKLTLLGFGAGLLVLALYLLRRGW